MNADLRRVAKRKKLLGMAHGTARARLERMLLFSLSARLELDICFRCGKRIKTVAEMSVDHKQDWQTAVDPVKAFFDLSEIVFSHLDCNRNAAHKRRLPHGNAKGRNCDCEGCISSRNAYNAKWMAAWRASGKDKSRVSNQGP